MTSFIKSVESPSHQIQFEFSDQGPNFAKVTTLNSEAINKDLEILVKLGKPHE